MEDLLDHVDGNLESRFDGTSVSTSICSTSRFGSLFLTTDTGFKVFFASKKVTVRAEFS